MNKGFNKIFSLLVLLILSTLLSCKGSSNSASDAFGVKDGPNVNVSLMAVSPANKSLFIGESIQFAASGGSAPYVFSLNSGVGATTSTGFYTAPGLQGTAVIQATDAKGETAFATVSISIQISISPTSTTLNSGDTLLMTGSGGIPPYSYSIVAGSGSIDANTGLYDSTGVVSGSAVIQVRDSSANTAFAAITINPSLIISPQIQTIAFGEQVNFSAVGGNIPYTYSILSGAGTINAATGVFVGPSSTGSTIVRVTDSSANSVDSVITIIDAPIINRPRDQIGINRTLSFTTSNGSPPYTYSIVSGGGSVIAGTGAFTAPADSDTTVVQVTDVNGNTDSTSINTFVPKYLATGQAHTCEINFSDISTSVSKCWGRTGYAIGNGGHVGPEPNYFMADDVSELGDNLPTVDLGIGVLAKFVRVGRYFTCAITTTDKLKCFGYNNSGQLGQGDRTSRGFAADEMGNDLPFVDLGVGRTVNNVLPVEDVISIQYHSVCVILDNNEMKCFGYGGKGKLGHGNTTNYGDGATEVGDNLPNVDFNADNAIQVSVGHEHTCAVLQNNNLKCWGESGDGQTGLETTADQVAQPRALSAVDLGVGRTALKVSTGFYHTCALLDDNTIKCFGRNNYGQLGIENNTTTGDDPGEMGAFLPTVNLGTGKTAIDIALMGEASCALLNDNTVKCWGRNNYGQLGVGSTTTLGDNPGEMGDTLITVDLGTGRSATKLSGGIYHMCATLDNGDVKCWGRNNAAQMAQGHQYDIGMSALSLGDNLAPINLSSTATINNIQVNEYTGCAVLSNNTLKCWGTDYYGSRGTGNSSIGDEDSDMGANLLALDVGTNNPFKKIESSLFVTCGQSTDNRLACWGYAGEGSRASGNSENFGFLSSHWGDNIEYIDFGAGRTVKDFDVGYRGGCAILDNDDLACWGRGDNGANGHGNTADRGDAIGEVGNSFTITDVGNISTVVQVSRGLYNTCVRFADGRLKCWGQGTYGQNGVGSTAQLGDGGGEMGNSLPFINLGTGVTSQHVCTGESFSCSLMNNNQIKCWGRNNYGQLGIGSTASIGDTGVELGDNLAYVDLGTGRSATQVECGRYHACAILDNEQLKCWGRADMGQLGNGGTAHVGNAPAEMGDNLSAVNLGTDKLAIGMSLGHLHTCVVLDDNSVKCFGYNLEGQLGLGHRTNIGTLNITMGDSLGTVETE